MTGKKAKGSKGYPETLYVRDDGAGNIFGRWTVCEDGWQLRTRDKEETEVAEYRLVRKTKVRTIVEVEQ